MTSFEVLYGHQCRTPLNWIESGEKVIFGPDLIDEAETTICRLQENLKPARSHVKKAMLTKDVDHWNLKLEIMSTCRFHQ
jgi:hypothetical protein